MLKDELRTATGPVLADGTPLADLIDVERRQVSLRLLSDPEVYDLELRTLFPRVWTVVAHETELPERGDYVTRAIGEDPVVVIRDRDDQVRVMLNVCPHRGMKVCRTECGNDTQLKCPYHGWTFATDGRFLGAPVAKEQMHGDVFDKSDLGLQHARVERFAGFVFATWDETTPSLDEYLGDIKWYLQIMFDRTEPGLTVLGPPQRFMIRSNWKCPGEQHAGDGYHTFSLHKSLEELGILDPPGAQDEVSSVGGGLNVAANGHGLRCIDMSQAYEMFKDVLEGAQTPMDKMRILLPPGLLPDMVEELPTRLSEGQLEVMANYPPSVGGLFPNMGAFSLPFMGPDGPSAIIAFHAFVPKGVGQFEFVNWYLAERNAPSYLRAQMRRAATLAFGSSGYVETDDADTWPQMYAASRGAMGRQQTMKYQALTGDNRPDWWPGPGDVHAGFSKDDNQWKWWLRYRDMMTGRTQS